MPTAPNASTAVAKSFSEVMTDISIISNTLTQYGVPEASAYVGMSLNNLLDSMIKEVFEDPSFDVDSHGNPRYYLVKNNIKISNLKSYKNKVDANLMEKFSARCIQSGFCNNTISLLDTASTPDDTSQANDVPPAFALEKINDLMFQTFLSLIADNMFWVTISGEWKLRSSSSDEYIEQYADGYKVINGNNVVGPDMLRQGMLETHNSENPDDQLLDLRGINFFCRVMDTCCYVTQEFTAYFLGTARVFLECGGSCSTSVLSAKPLEGPKLETINDKEIPGEITLAGKKYSNFFILLGLFQSNLGADPVINWTNELAIDAIEYIKANLNSDLTNRARLSQINGIVAKQQF